LIETVEDRDNVRFSAKAFRTGLEAVEHKEPGIATDEPSQRERFGKLGDEEVAAPGAAKHRNDTRGTETIGVRLDHCASMGSAQLLQDKTVIGGESRQINRQHPRSRVEGLFFRNLAKHVSPRASPKAPPS
jgi:hypothetical protein